jgi:hypothetical protein
LLTRTPEQRRLATAAQDVILPWSFYISGEKHSPERTFQFQVALAVLPPATKNHVLEKKTSTLGF